MQPIDRYAVSLLPDSTPPKSLESRMASGALPANLDSATSSAACELIGDTVTQPQTSSSQRALSVLDGMTVCEVAWHEGGSLPETLFACLYFHPAVFSAMLADLGWELPPLAMVGGVHPTMDLKVKEGLYNAIPAGVGRVVLLCSVNAYRGGVSLPSSLCFRPGTQRYGNYE